MAAFVAFLAEQTKVGERSARLYVAHLQRFAAWLEQRYQPPLLDATTHDLREYRAELAHRQKTASGNAALTALRRFYCWARDTDQVAKNPAQHLVDVEFERLAPKGFAPVDRRRLQREAGKAGPLADAVVTTLINTALRAQELVTTTWERVTIQPRSGWIDIVGKCGKRRRVPLNAEALLRSAGLRVWYDTLPSNWATRCAEVSNSGWLDPTSGVVVNHHEEKGTLPRFR